MCTNVFLVHLSVDGYPGGLYLLTWSTVLQQIWEGRVTSFPLDVYPGQGWLGHTVICWGSSIWFSIMTVLICTPPHPAQVGKFQLLQHTCLPLLSLEILGVLTPVVVSWEARDEKVARVSSHEHMLFFRFSKHICCPASELCKTGGDYSLHFPGKETEAWRNGIIGPKPHNWWADPPTAV